MIIIILTKERVIMLSKKAERTVRNRSKQFPRDLDNPSDIPVDLSELEGLWNTIKSREYHWHPAVDIIDKGKDVLVKVDISGVDEKDIHLSFDGHILDISGTREKGKIRDNGTYLVKERLSGRFHRAVHLPLFVDPKGLKTRYEKGILEILVPKRKDSRKRAIKAGVG